MPFLTDTFTETSDTNLPSHTADIGSGTWHGISRTMVVIGSEDRVRGDSDTGTSSAYHDASPAGAEYDLDFILRHTGASSFPGMGVMARYDSGSNSYLQCYVSPSQVDLQEISGGVAIETVTTSATFGSGTDHVSKLEVRNGTNGIKLYVGGTLRCQLTADVVTGAGKVGVRSRIYGRVDSLVATDYATGVTADLSGTLGALTLSSDATVANGAGATLTGTLAAVTLSSSATVAAGVGATVAITLQALQASSEAAVVDGAGGALTVTLDNLVMSSSAVVGTLPVSAELSGTLGALTVSSSATVANGVGASLSSTLAALTLSSSASVTSPGDAADATLAVTLAALTVSATAEVHGEDVLLPAARRIGGTALSAPSKRATLRDPRRIGGSVLRRAA